MISKEFDLGIYYCTVDRACSGASDRVKKLVTDTAGHSTFDENNLDQQKVFRNKLRQGAVEILTGHARITAEGLKLLPKAA